MPGDLKRMPSEEATTSLPDFKLTGACELGPCRELRSVAKSALALLEAHRAQLEHMDEQTIKQLFDTGVYGPGGESEGAYLFSTFYEKTEAVINRLKEVLEKTKE